MKTRNKMDLKIVVFQSAESIFSKNKNIFKYTKVINFVILVFLF